LRSPYYCDKLNNKMMNTPQLSTYIDALELLCKKEKLQLDYRVQDHTLWIENIPFYPINTTLTSSKTLLEKGILKKSLDSFQKKFCHENNISYFTEDQNLFLVLPDTILSIEPRNLNSALNNISYSRWITPSSTEMHGPLTTIISPNAFDILDILFRLSNDELIHIKSGLEFSKKYGSYQPKLSNMMRSLRDKTMLDFKVAICSLDMNWWKSALRYPATRRSFTSFFQQAKPYHSLNAPDDAYIYEKLNELVTNTSKNQLALGPTEVAKGYGFLRDPDYAIWGTIEALQIVKKTFRLVPGFKRESTNWFLATPVHGIRSEAILSLYPVNGSNNSSTMPRTISQSHVKEGLYQYSNLFRSIWDLSYGESRLSEVQELLLGRILNANRSK